jgi:A/G-specific adenine glycosylase
MSEFAARLLEWFDRAGRHDLPWQQPRSPYRVWISEVMLQQTRVETVIPYFQRFMARFPDVASLAAAPLDEVLHHWSGLGYYARARNLHRAAGAIMTEHGGRFPEDVTAVMALPGIGRSTAGAILAQAFGQRHAILDGNVKRVLARVHAVQGWPGTPAVEQRLWALAAAETPDARTGDYTQAIMDLGATLCRRTRPACGECPVESRCEARALGQQAEFPAPRPRRARPLRHARMLLLSDPAGSVLLQRRPPQGIWGGLWCPPELGEESAEDWASRLLGASVDQVRPLATVRHGFTHFELEIEPIAARLASIVPSLMEPDRWVWYNAGSPAKLGLAAAVSRLVAARGPGIAADLSKETS